MLFPTFWCPDRTETLHICKGLSCTYALRKQWLLLEAEREGLAGWLEGCSFSLSCASIRLVWGLAPGAVGSFVADAAPRQERLFQHCCSWLSQLSFVEEDGLVYSGSQLIIMARLLESRGPTLHTRACLKKLPADSSLVTKPLLG